MLCLECSKENTAPGQDRVLMKPLFWGGPDFLLELLGASCHVQRALSQFSQASPTQKQL